MRKGKRYVANFVGFFLLISESYAQSDTNAPANRASEQPSQPALIFVQQELAETDYYKISCTKPQDHDAADLCEQRRMAQAAEDSVWWARVQAWLGGLGFAGILITLIFSGLGTRVAARQVRLSRQALIYTDRAFVYPFQVIWAAVKDVKTDKVQLWRLSIQWKNSGNTPTRHLRMWTNLSAKTEPIPDDFSFPDLGTGDIPTFIAPHNTVDSVPLDLSLDDLELLIANNRHIYAWGWVEYDDVFERTPRHRTEFCYKFTAGGNPRDPNRMTFNWTTHNKYNGADEECETPLKTASPKDMGDR